MKDKLTVQERVLVQQMNHQQPRFRWTKARRANATWLVVIFALLFGLLLLAVASAALTEQELQKAPEEIQREWR